MHPTLFSMTQAIGDTPLLRFDSQGETDCAIMMKIEGMNPGGSIKDRAALFMIEEAERRGRLTPGSTIIEPTSGNTGIGLAWIGASKGYPVTLLMPETMSKERRDLLAAYGAKLILTPGAEGMKGAIARAEQLLAESPGAWMARQFDNPMNPEAHRRTTGPEIWTQTDGQVDVLVAGVGTGGTLTGAGEYLREKNPRLRVVAVEPAASPVLSGGKPGLHPLQGIGAGFVPGVLNTTLIDEILPVTGEEAFASARALRDRQGVLAGISSGAALHAARQIAARPGMEGKTIVVILPDSGERYLSTPLFEN